MKQFVLCLAIFGGALMATGRQANAQYAGSSDYLYTVYYGESQNPWMDLLYDYELHIESPTIPGYWQLVETFPTLAEAEFWEQMFTQYNTEIVRVYSPAFMSRTQVGNLQRR